MRQPALLTEVLEATPAGLLTARSTPRGTAIPVLGSVLLDLTDEVPPDVAGGIAHMVGVLPEDPRLPGLVAGLGDLGYAALTVKRRGGSLVALAELAAAQGIAVLEVRDDAAWSAVHAAVTSAIGAAGLRASSPRATPNDALHETANVVAAAFGGSVSIEDLDRRVIAYSSLPGQRIDAYREAGILQRLVPSKATDREQYQQVYAAPGIIRFPASGEELPRSAVAIRAGDIPLGTIWAIEPDEGVTDAQLRSLTDAAAVAGVHLLRLRHADEIGQLARGDALVALIDGNIPTDATMARIGLPPGPSRMLLVAPADSAARTQLTVVSAAAGRYLSAYAPSAVVAALPGWTGVLLPDRDEAEVERLALGVADEAARAVGQRVRVALGSPGLYPGQVAQMYAEVLQIATAAESTAVPSAVVRRTDVVDRILLDGVDDLLAERPVLASPAIDRLLAHDRQHDGALARTLLVWLEEQGEVRACAERLATHPNTVRYRLRRAFAVMGHPPWDPDARLAAWIRLRRALRS